MILITGLQITDYRLQIRSIAIKVFLFSVFCSLFSVNGYAQEDKKVEPIIVNGDKVEYSSDNKEVTATGNVEVTYKGAKLTCQRLTVNPQTKVGEAFGNARLDDQKGVIEGSKIIYNFDTKTGIMIDSNFRANPYFGKAKKVDKVSDAEFIAFNGYFTTCNLDRPHYRINSKRINLFPGDKIQTKQDTFYVGNIPLMYLTQYNHSLKDPIMHVQVMPGKSKEWGPYLLTAWRYNLTENMTGRIYFDYRSDLGAAEGFGTNYTTQGFGKGDFKYYYTQERDKSKDLNQDDVNAPKVFQRYFIRERHKWDIDERTNFTSEYYKIVDSKMILYPSGGYNFLKNYFFREYEKNTQPISYVLLHHNFNYSSADVYIEKRTNRWYTETEKLPQITYSLPSIQIGGSPFYFENSSSATNYNYKEKVPSPSTSDVSVIRFDTSNKFSLPMKIAIFKFTPFVKSQQTYDDKDVFGASTVLRTIFYSGADVSTKFFRLFNVKSSFLGMDINGLRHIITPSIGYAFNHEPTVLGSKMKLGDSISRNNSASLELSNKLQTKRKNVSVDLVDFNITNTYAFKPKTGRGSNLSDFLFKLKLLPYSWLRIEGDATYKHSGNRSDDNYKRFTNANYDIYFDFGEEKTFGVGQRYQRKGANEITYELQYRLNPKWKFSIYQRRMRGHGPSFNRGLKEQQYTIARDLHCWEVDMAYNGTKGKGSTIWFIFRLKAFPEMEFGFDQSYHAPKSGRQRNE